jgi:triphosphoribosyl-dephospho-CoA synthase
MTFKSAEENAYAGVLALLLEVSANPKPGNVDRLHDFPDLKYEHFLASASAVYPTFLKCARGEGSIGNLILEAVKRSFEVCKRNVHFGSFMLLIPLIRCQDDTKAVVSALKETTYQDSLAVLEAFEICKPRVMDVKELSLKSESIKDEIIGKNINLYDWLCKSPEENVVARELVEGYWRSLEGCEVLLSYYQEHKDLNTAIVYAYLHLLSKFLDPLVIAKHGREVAEYVREKASEVLISLDRGDLKAVEMFDEELIEKSINPGSIADLTVVAIYLALKEGLI